jgi:hypothetical protein
VSVLVGFLAAGVPCLWLLGEYRRLLDRALTLVEGANDITDDANAITSELLGVVESEDDDAETGRVWS